MKKILKKTGKVLLIKLIVLAIFLLILFIYHRVMLNKEKDIYKAIIFAKGYNKTLEHESLEEDKIASKKINENPKPECPMLIFVSLDGENGNGDEKTIEEWRKYARDYTSDMPNAKLIELDCGHYVHNLETETVETEIRTFIERLENQSAR